MASSRRKDYSSHPGTLTHPTLSIGLVALGPSHCVAAGVGNCRVYRRRAKRWSVIVPDQTLGTVATDLRNALPAEFASEPSQVLGFQPSVKPVFWDDARQRDDVFVLCSVGVWAGFHEVIVSHTGDIDALLALPESLVASASSAARPASACVLTP